MGEAYIVAATRTAGGRKGGRLSGWHPVDLGAEVLNGLVDRVNADPALVEKARTGRAAASTDRPNESPYPERIW